MYNQPTKVMPDGRHVGLLYKNPIDCLWKTLKTEGPLGWYKGESCTLVESNWLADDVQGLRHTSCALRLTRKFRWRFMSLSRSNTSWRRILTLTANDIIIGLYKRLLFGAPDDDD